MDEVEDVTAWTLDDEEWQGDHSKIWLSPPRASELEDSRRWLFKPSRRVKLRGKAGRPQRTFTWFDAQSELIAFEVAQLLGVPSASIRLVRRRGTSGCISRDVRSADEELHSGDTFLSGLSLPDYIPNAERRGNRTGHHLEAIGQVLEGITGPVAHRHAGAGRGSNVCDAWKALMNGP